MPLTKKLVELYKARLEANGSHKEKALLKNVCSGFLKWFIENNHGLCSSFLIRATSNGFENGFPKW